MIHQRTRIPKKRSKPRVVHSERTAHITGHKRVRLYGKAREQRRAEIFARAGGRCEERIPHRLYNGFYFMDTTRQCGRPATEWSHMRHGAHKCDCLSPKCSIASCEECHKKRHNAGGKPCPKKPSL